MFETDKQKKRSAIVYQSLYLLNLLLIPGIAFMILIWHFAKNYQNKGWHRIHLYRALQVSIAAGIFLIVVPAISIFLGRNVDALIAMMLVYVVSIHALFVLIGILNLSRAMSQKLPLF